MSMHPDLKWLAENVSEWPMSCRFIAVGTNKNGKRHMLNWSMEDYAGYLPSFGPNEYLQARQELGLDNTETPEEKEEFDRIEARQAADMINNPPHYHLHEGYEVYDLRQDLAQKAMAANVPHDQYSDWDRALEYLLRMWEKNGVEDAKKGRWYMDKLIQKLEQNSDR